MISCCSAISFKINFEIRITNNFFQNLHNYSLPCGGCLRERADAAAERCSVGLGGDRGLTGKDIVSRVMGIKDQATEFTLNLPATKFAKKLLDTGVNAILGGPVMGEEIRSMDDMQQLQLNVPSEVTTSKVEQDLSQLNERQSVATDVAKNVKKTNGGQPMVLPLVTGGGDLVGRETKANKNVLQMNQSGQQIPILAAVDPNNMHIPSTYAVLNIIDANNGL